MADIKRCIGCDKKLQWNQRFICFCCWVKVRFEGLFAPEFIRNKSCPIEPTKEMIMAKLYAAADKFAKECKVEVLKEGA